MGGNYEACKRWREKNPEYMKQWREANKEKCRQYRKRYRDKDYTGPMINLDHGNHVKEWQITLEPFKKKLTADLPATNSTSEHR